MDMPNRIIHLRSLRKSPFGPQGLRVGFAVDSSGFFRNPTHGAFTISIRAMRAVATFAKRSGPSTHETFPNRGCVLGRYPGVLTDFNPRT